VTAVALPDGVDAAELTTLAMLNADGTLTPVPTAVHADGTVTALVRGGAVLLPLRVEVRFTDLGGGTRRAEVADAAERLIVEGRGDGRFDPNAPVTARESAAMLLRALGVPFAYGDALTVGAARGLNAPGASADAPVTRPQAAELLANALEDAGLASSLSGGQADALLAGYPGDVLLRSQMAGLALRFQRVLLGVP
jgi:hypothetical protein